MAKYLASCLEFLMFSENNKNKSLPPPHQNNNQLYVQLINQTYFSNKSFGIKALMSFSN